MLQKMIGTTIRATFVSSGQTAVGITSELRDRDGTVVNTALATDSGNGHWFADHLLPNTPGTYLNRWVAAFNTSTYVEGQYVRAIAGDA